MNIDSRRPPRIGGFYSVLTIIFYRNVTQKGLIHSILSKTTAVIQYLIKI